MKTSPDLVLLDEVVHSGVAEFRRDSGMDADIAGRNWRGCFAFRIAKESKCEADEA